MNQITQSCVTRPPLTLYHWLGNNDKERSGQAHEVRLETTTGGVTKHNRPTGGLYILYKHIINTYYTCSLIISFGIAPGHLAPGSDREMYQYFPDTT